MAAGNFLPVDPAWLTMMDNAIDDMMAAWAIECRLIFPSIQTQCTNCVWDSITRSSRNIYRTGGPTPFGQNNICPTCGGQGLIMEPEHTETINLIISYGIKRNSGYLQLAGRTTLPQGVIWAEGYMYDLPRVLQSRVLIVSTAVEPILRARYELLSEPFDPNSLVQSKTFKCSWERKG